MSSLRLSVVEGERIQSSALQGYVFHTLLPPRSYFILSTPAKERTGTHLPALQFSAIDYSALEYSSVACKRPTPSSPLLRINLQWVLDKQDLMKERQKDLKFLTEEEYWKLQIFFANVIQALGEHLKLRQQVIATATVYFKRFYARYSLKSIDPVLMAPTCVFLASKVEEFGVVSNTRLISAATSVLKTRFSFAFPKEFPYRMNHILECEFYLLELMDCCLIVYHPYRPLLQYVQDMGQEDMLLPLAWRIVNDTYRTDLCLLYPPFMIALACLHVACVVQQKDARQWFAELSVDMDKILEIIRVILKLYDQWKNFDDRKEIAAVLNKMPKPKPPPNSESDQSSNGNQSNSYSQS
ncbi:cyclin-C isoform X1 [Oreochromis niloticus]|uniref:Cyclin-C n=2 Tax=Oreochromis niloticus TaxID=8128 RepID=A0A669CXF8_ORENI|nr:cyclin-C isoform X1 [Oreochromis niloticus]